MGSRVLQEIKAILDEAERMKGAWFWTPPTSAGGRASYERYHSHDEVAWEEGGHSYTARFTVRCSCKNIYVEAEYTRDGKKTTITAIRNSYRRMTEEETAC